MPFKKEETQGNTRLKIQGALSIYKAVALQKELQSCLELDTGLELDLEDVTECDTAGLQLLWAARKTTEKKGKHFHVIGAPKIVLDTIAGAGLNQNDVI